MSEDLRNKGIVIRDETQEGANTANRVGSWMVQAESEKADLIRTSDNYKVVYTPDGTIPIVDLSGKVDKKVIYNVTQVTGVTYTDKITARNAVTANLRGTGQIITYKLTTGWVTEQYIGTDVSGWATEANWKNMGEMPNVVTYSPSTNDPGGVVVDWSTADKKLNTTLSSTGEIAGSLTNTSVLWRLKLEPNTTYKISFANTFTDTFRFFLHETTVDSAAKTIYSVADVDTVSNSRYKIFKTGNTAIYLTCYLKLNSGATIFNITDTLQFISVASSTEAAINIEDTSVRISRLKNSVYTTDTEKQIDWSTAEQRTGTLAPDGTWTGSSITSTVLWRLKLEPNTTYAFRSPPIKSSSKFVLLHTSIENTPSSYRYTVDPTKEELLFSTGETAIYATMYLRLTYSTSDFDIRETLTIIANPGTSRVMIFEKAYTLDQIINSENTGGGDSNSGVYYNVRDYGAKGDGATDDTLAIQAAMDAVIDGGGGTLFIPNGIYRLATVQENYGAKAHLILKPTGGAIGDPQRPYRKMIRIKGEGIINTSGAYAAHTGISGENVQLQSGAILRSDIIGDLYTNTSTLHTSVLASGGMTSPWGMMNYSLVRLEDFGVQVHVEGGKFPRLCGIDMAFANSVYTDNILIYPDLSNLEQTAPSKAGHYSCGFIAPKIGCNPEQFLNNIYVKAGFRYGFIFSEHANVDNCIAWCCENSYTMSLMYHMSNFKRLHAQNCKSIISSLDVSAFNHTIGTSYIRIGVVGIETNVGQAPTDFNYQYFVNDAGNRLKGKLEYHIVASNVGVDNGKFIKNGGTGVVANPIF